MHFVLRDAGRRYVPKRWGSGTSVQLNCTYISSYLAYVVEGFYDLF